MPLDSNVHAPGCTRGSLPYDFGELVIASGLGALSATRAQSPTPGETTLPTLHCHANAMMVAVGDCGAALASTLAAVWPVDHPYRRTRRGRR